MTLFIDPYHQNWDRDPDLHQKIAIAIPIPIARLKNDRRFRSRSQLHLLSDLLINKRVILVFLVKNKVFFTLNGGMIFSNGKYLILCRYRTWFWAKLFITSNLEQKVTIAKKIALICNCRLHHEVFTKSLYTVLPRLVRMRTIKLTSFFLWKKIPILSNFLRFLALLSRESLIWKSYNTDKSSLPT